MSTSINVKSAVVGGLVVALLIVSIGAVRGVFLEEYGRFEMATNTDCAFVLDTATGQVWALQTGQSGGVLIRPPYTGLEFFDPKSYDLADSNEPVSR